MPKIKYFYNPHSLKYEKVKTSVLTYLGRIFGFLSAAAVFGAILLFFAYRYLASPNEKRLQREVDQYKAQLEILSHRMDELNGVLADLQKRDDNIYREIFEADPIDPSIRMGGYGGVDRYKKLASFGNSEALIEVNKKLDRLTKQAYVQSKSYDELFKLAKEKAERLACTPAIQPISNKDLERMASGYGWRIDPIYKTTKMHAGIDFTASVGTPIYATGNGTIRSAEFNSGGYGLCVEINHGYGYETLYGHMSRIAVRAGQKVKRGDLIGYVGNTGKSTGPHVHYEVIKNGNKIDPINFFFNDLTASDYEKMRKISAQSNQSFD